MNVPAPETRQLRNGNGFPWLCLVVAALTGCAALEDIPAGVCGNGVLEGVEECDDFPSTWCRAPGSKFECRIDCSTHACAEGATCGADAVCRTPTSRFKASSFAAGEVDSRLAVGDLDGDQRDEVLVGTSLHRAQASFTAERTLKSVTNVSLGGESSVVGSFNGDARDDLLCWSNTEAAIEELHADETGVLWPVTHIVAAPMGGARRVFAADRTGDGLPEPHLLVDRKIYLVPSSNHDPFAGQITTDVNAKDVPGTIPTGNFAVEPPGKLDSEEVALAALNEPRVHVYQLDSDVGARKIAVLDMQAGQKVGRRGLFTGDYNGDGRLDLFVSSGSARNGLYVAYGLGDGSFHSRIEGMPSSHGDNRFSTGAIALDAYAEVLAVADLDGDGKSDFVLERGAVLSSEAVPCVGKSTCQLQHAFWAGARVADFNRDGHMDVIGAPPDTRELTFWMGIGDGRFNTFPITTAGIPARTGKDGLAHPLLSVGDFDGDLSPDLAFAESEARTVDQAGLTVLFGKPLSVPSDLREVGTVDRLTDLSSGMLFVNDSNNNTLSDLVMLAADGKAQGVGMFAGQTSRLLFSSLALPVDAANRDKVKLQEVVVGRFQKRVASAEPEKGSRDDMIMLASNQSEKLIIYFLPNGPDGFDGAAVSQTPFHLLDTAVPGQTLLLPFDVDGDEIDELLVAPFKLHGQRFKHDRIRRNETGFEMNGFASTVRGLDKDPTSVYELSRTLASFRDLNHDGRRDLTLHARPSRGANSYELAFLGDTKSRLAEGLAFELPRHDFAAYLNADADPELELATGSIDDTSIRLFDLDFTTGEVSEIRTLRASSSVNHLVAGDFDGDGVEDLAVSNDQLEIFWGVPVRE